jgi:hypothetical protein
LAGFIFSGNQTFDSLTASRKLAVSDHIFALMGIDAKVPGLYHDVRLHRPLFPTDNVVPAAQRDAHLELIRGLCKFDRRFRMSVDPGYKLCLVLADAGRVAEIAHPPADDSGPGIGRPAAVPKMAVKHMEAYKQHNFTGAVHTESFDYTALAEVFGPDAGTTVAPRDCGRQYGTLVLRPSSCGRLQPGDQILRFDAYRMTYPAQKSAEDALDRARKLVGAQPRALVTSFAKCLADEKAAFTAPPPVATPATKGTAKSKPPPPPWHLPLAPFTPNSLIPPHVAERFTIRFFRPPGGSELRPAPTPGDKTYTALSLSQGCARKILGIDDLARREKQQGLTVWSAKHMAAQEERLQLTDPRADEYPALKHAVNTQQLVLSVRDSTIQLQACLARPVPTEDAAAAARARVTNILEGLTAVLSGAGDVFKLWQDKNRLANRQERVRRRQRLYDRLVHEVCLFAAPNQKNCNTNNNGGLAPAAAAGGGGGEGAPPEQPPGPPAAGLPPESPEGAGPPPDRPPDPAPLPDAGSGPPAADSLPVVFVGDWAIGGESGGVFSQLEFLRRLAKVAIVIICSEHCTSKLCPTCGRELAHPQKPTGRTFNGTSFCPAPQCASRGRFFNRDVLAAASIVDRMICGFLVGGSLGSYEKPVKGIPKDSFPISLFGALLEPRPVAAAAAGPW